MKLNKLFAVVIAVLIPALGYTQAPGHKSYISNAAGAGDFPLSINGKAASIYVGADEYIGVKRAVNSLITDLHSVSGASASLTQSNQKQLVLIGTLGKNDKIDQLVREKKLNVTSITGKWETYLIQVVQKPFAGVDQALIITGSDKRGTIFGVYDLSAQIGVSPWYWWADVPVKKRNRIYVKTGSYSDGEPAVKYRGIFINDEAPAFSGWTHEKFGGVNHNMYEKMFELILRLKGNYLWPAMWGNAFNDDDKLNPVLADEYGVVMGTSHHEPMDRAQQEWKRYGKGQWNYENNKDVLQDFWRKGIENMGSKETIVTVGMRGDGDMPMTEGSNIKLLEGIVKDQRQIISEVTGKDASATPQMWALYKEVQAYYDKGMRVPDDITLLLCDDNWGNIRKLPNLNAHPRKGGYGIYYHFDYVGGPRNYKWLNTNPISKTWEQMHLAYEYNARQIWIVNVGDLKPMEFPISFFLDYAWNPNRWPANSLKSYTEQWAAQQFGKTNAAEIARILTLYTKYNGRRKPELLDQNTYSLTNYREFETVVADYNKLRDEAEKLYTKIPAAAKDAYYQLVLHPVIACANLNEMYYEVAKNKLYAEQSRAATNTTASRVKALFKRDKEISRYYNDTLAHGKWNHMMDQTHISYTYWQQPEVDKVPSVTEISVPAKAEMGVAIEGSAKSWSGNASVSGFPQFYPWEKGGHYAEIFNKGSETFNYDIESSAAYVGIKPKTGKVMQQQRVWINVDWAKAPRGTSHVPLKIKGAGGEITVEVTVNNEKPALAGAFAENNGYIAIEATYYTKAVNSNAVSWLTVPDYGKTLSGVTPVPVTAKKQQAIGNSPRLEYNINLKDTGTVSIITYVSPTIDFRNQKGLFYGISIDDEQPQLVDINTIADSKDWNAAVAENIRKMETKHHIAKPGNHVLKYWMVDAGVVLQKLVVNTGGLKESYLGPPAN
ncbi:glycosyl hydrolase 115 family protein [Mucilaginibacter agri]|uniref:Glycosyl hydrolase n=1 Tax=Mucilaginibacter agri TaxID=2695265 RepID=A0A965ZJB0_9SPHI|nr:glycosyl hydrolase 115 family protein [Mucilaginibacter agri]NCD71009.1 glycosyl hydrolase [Mucilaginibacter agri]